MIKRKEIFLFSTFTLFQIISFAQQGVSGFSVVTEAQTSPVLTASMSIQQVKEALNDVTQKVVFVMQLEDSAAAKVHVKLTSDSLSWNKFNEVVNTNGANLSEGVSVIKNGDELRITLGSFSGLANYIAAIEIESASGQKSRMYQINH